MDKDELCDAANFIRFQGKVYRQCVLEAMKVSGSNLSACLDVQEIAAHMFQAYSDSCRDFQERMFEAEMMKQEKKQKAKK